VCMTIHTHSVLTQSKPRKTVFTGSLPWRRSFGFSARESGGQSGQGLPFSEQSAFLPVSVKADGSGGNIAPDLVLMHGGVGRVEIELRCGRIVRVDAEINPDALARVLAVVDRSQ